MNEVDYAFKVVFTGSKGVGKSVLIYSVIVEKFPKRVNIDVIGGPILYDERDAILKPVNGGLGDLPFKKIQLDNEQILLQLWVDKNMSTTYTYDGASVIAICFDLSSSNYNDDVEKRVTQLKQTKLTSEIPIVLVGCKNDLAVPNLNLNDSLKPYDFLRTSAKTMENVKVLLQTLGKISLREYHKSKL